MKKKAIYKCPRVRCTHIDTVQPIAESGVQTQSGDKPQNEPAAAKQGIWDNVRDW